MRPNNNPVLTNVSASGTISSNAQWSDMIIRFSFQAVVTGSASGTIIAQASNDFFVGAPPNQFKPTNWSNIGSSVTVTNTGVYIIPEIESSYEYIRLTYTDTSGGTATGSISARMKSCAL